MTTRILKPGETGEIVCEFCGWPFTHTGDETGSQPIYCPACAVGQRIIKEQVARAKAETDICPYCGGPNRCANCHRTCAKVGGLTPEGLCAGCAVAESRARREHVAEPKEA